LNPQVLVLGASGYIGGRLCQEMAAEAIGTYRHKPVFGGLHFDAVSMDLSGLLDDYPTIQTAVIGYAQSNLDLCRREEALSREINVCSTRRVIDLLKERSIKTIFLSSDCVFDGKKGDYIEEDAANPINLYGKHKIEIEHYLRENAPDSLILRLPKVFGTDIDDGKILSSWISQMQKGGTIRCASDQRFSPLDIRDIVASLRAAIRSNLSGVYHVANTRSCTWAELFLTLAKSLHKKPKFEECSIGDFNTLEPRPLNISMNPSKFLKTTNLKFRTLESCCDEIADKISFNK